MRFSKPIALRRPPPTPAPTASNGTSSSSPRSPMVSRPPRRALGRELLPLPAVVREPGGDPQSQAAPFVVAQGVAGRGAEGTAGAVRATTLSASLSNSRAIALPPARRCAVGSDRRPRHAAPEVRRPHRRVAVRTGVPCRNRDLGAILAERELVLRAFEMDVAILRRIRSHVGDPAEASGSSVERREQLEGLLPRMHEETLRWAAEELLGRGTSRCD